jgi:hypothetical protein
VGGLCERVDLVPVGLGGQVREAQMREEAGNQARDERGGGAEARLVRVTNRARERAEGRELRERRKPWWQVGGGKLRRRSIGSDE